MENSLQQDLFAIGETPEQPTNAPQPVQPQPKKHYNFNDYVTIFCGDRKLAMHWFLKKNPPKQGE